MEKIIITLSGPSGSGKNTIIDEISKITDFEQTPHATTRACRGEQDNEYIFLTKENFLEQVKSGDIMEYTEIAGNYYGTCTPKKNNNIMIFNPMGIEFIKEYAPKHGFKLITIFLDISIEQCHQRMKLRGDDEKTIQKKLDHDTELINVGKGMCQFHVNASNPIEQVVADTLEIINKHCK